MTSSDPTIPAVTATFSMCQKLDKTPTDSLPLCQTLTAGDYYAVSGTPIAKSLK